MTDQPERDGRKPDSIIGDRGGREPILPEPSEQKPILDPIISADELGSLRKRTEEAGNVATTTPPALVSPEPAVRARTGDAIAEAVEDGARACLVASLVLVPLAFDPRTFDTFNLAKITVLWVLSLLALGGWGLSAYFRRTPPTRPRSPIVPLTLLFLGVAAVATLVSPYRRLAFFGLYHRYGGLVSLTVLIGFSLLVASLYQRFPVRLRHVVMALAVASAVAGGYAILQQLGIDAFRWRIPPNTPQHPIGTLGNPTFTGAFLGISFPFTITALLGSPSRGRRMAWGVVGLIAVFGLAATRSAVGGLAAAAGVLAMLLFVSRLDAFKKVAIVAVALLLLAVAPIVQNAVSDSTGPDAYRPGSASYRAAVWDAGWRMFVSRPIIGYGPEGFFGQYPRFRTPSEARVQGLAITDAPHNVFLNVAATTGAAGLLSFVALAAAALLVIGRRASRGATTERALAAAFAGGLVAYLAQAIYSIDVPSLALIGWSSIGAIAALSGGTSPGTGDGSHVAVPAVQRSEDAEPTEVAAASWMRRLHVVPVIVALLLVVFIIGGFGPLRADHAAWAAAARPPTKWSATTMSLYEKAIRLNPHEAAYRGLAGSYLESSAKDRATPRSEQEALRTATSFFEQAHRIQPDNVFFMINAARTLVRLGTDFDAKYFRDAAKWVAMAAEHDRRDPQMHDLYADVLTRWAKKLKGAEAQRVQRQADAHISTARALRSGRNL